MSDRVKVCPKCDSTDVRIEMDAMIAIGAPSEYRCENCGFMSYIFPEAERQETKKADVKKPIEVRQDTEVVNTSTGKFLFFGSKVWWKVVSPLIVLFSGYMMYVISASPENVGNLYPGIAEFYLGAIFMFLGVLTTFASYALPDKMSLSQGRIFGAVVLFVFLMSASFGAGVISLPANL